MSFRGMLAGSVSLAALTAAAPAFAADATEAPEIVVVTGIRASIDRAINIKRDSTTIVDAVSAEDIGKFSDKNVADALQRVPGVNTVSAASGEGGFDENDRVSIRGTNASLTQTVVDGHTIANGDWFILDSTQPSAAASASRCCPPKSSTPPRCIRASRRISSKAASPAWSTSSPAARSPSKRT